MLFSLSLILILGFSLSGIFNRLRLPGLLGMILTGIILGPYALNLISPDILDISSDLREIARVFDSCIVKKSLKPLERLYFFVKFHISILSTFEPCVII